MREIEQRMAALRADHSGAIERLSVPIIDTAEMRVDNETTADDGFTVRGHAAVFDVASEDLGGFTETVARGAFRKVLDAHQDVRLLYDHAGLVLARTKSNTLQLREDPRGLAVYARLADTTVGRDLRTAMQRGDIDQMSFAFIVGDDEWRITGSEEDGTEQIARTIQSVSRLFDVSVVAIPAYPQTDATMRDVAAVTLHVDERMAALEERVGELLTWTAGLQPNASGDISRSDTRSTPPLEELQHGTETSDAGASAENGAHGELSAGTATDGASAVALRRTRLRRLTLAAIE